MQWSILNDVTRPGRKQVLLSLHANNKLWFVTNEWVTALTWLFVHGFWFAWHFACVKSNQAWLGDPPTTSTSSSTYSWTGANNLLVWKGPENVFPSLQRQHNQVEIVSAEGDAFFASHFLFHWLMDVLAGSLSVQSNYNRLLWGWIIDALFGADVCWKTYLPWVPSVVYHGVRKGRVQPDYQCSLM